MLTVHIPLPSGQEHPTDHDQWFIESLAELMDDQLSTIQGAVGGFETGGDIVGICVFDADPKQMAQALTPLLKAHCPPGTCLHLYYEEDEPGETEEFPLFGEGEKPPCLPLPLTSPDMAYGSVNLKPTSVPIGFTQTDEEIFKAIATAPGLTRDNIGNAVDAMMHIALTDEEISSGLSRLLEAGYIHVDNQSFVVAPEIAEQLPRTAKGNISAYREEAWDQVNAALFQRKKKRGTSGP